MGSDFHVALAQFGDHIASRGDRYAGAVVSPRGFVYFLTFSSRIGSKYLGTITFVAGEAN